MKVIQKPETTLIEVGLVKTFSRSVTKHGSVIQMPGGPER